MSKPSKKSIRKAERKAARKAAAAAAAVAAVAAAKPSMLARADAFLARHAPSKTDLRWYKFEALFFLLAVGIVSHIHPGGLM